MIVGCGRMTMKITAPAHAAMPTNASPMMGSTPLPMPGNQAPTAAQQPGLQEPAEESPPMGVVAEVIQVPNYTYLRLTTAKGDEWVAVTSTQAVSVGKPVSLTRGHRMVDFTSKTLSRTFDSIWFGELSGS